MIERTGEMTRATPDGRAARESRLVEALATWGVAEDPESDALFQVIAGLRNVSDLLRELQQKGGEWLPAPLRDEIDATVAILGDGESLNAPSFRARVDRILASARESLDPGIAQRRAALSEQLLAWAPLLDRDTLDRTLKCLWRTERASGLADQLGAISDLQMVQAVLTTTRETIAAQIQARVATAPAAGAAAGEAASLARGALASGEPMFLLRARTALDDLHARQDDENAQARLELARARLAALCESARRRPGAAGDGAAARLRARAVEDAEGALEASARGSDGAADFEPVIGAWERTLQAVFAAGPAEGEEVRKTREALAREIVAGMRRLVPRDPASRDAAQKALASEASAIETALRDGGGGPSLPPILDRGAELLRQARERAESRRQEAFVQARAAAGELASFLETSGEELPTERVVRARLWLEQIEGILASGDAAGIASTATALREDLAELRSLAAQVARRRANREEAERDALRSEIARLIEAATGAASRNLRALAAEAEQRGGVRLPRLRNAVARARRSVEQSIRLEGGKVLRAAHRWLHRRGGAPDRPRSEPEQAVVHGVEALAAALEKNDLLALRQRTAELRAALRGATPGSRAWAKAALLAVLVAALAGLYPALRYFNERPQACLLKLDAPPRRPVRVWLVKNGRIVRDEEYGPADDGIRLSLPPGHYEVFVDERYTGRVVRIPGEREVTGVPLPPG